MPRTRLIRPDLFVDETLADVSIEARLFYIGMSTVADREGRLEDRPRRLKVELFPYDQHINIDALLVELALKGLIIRYSVDGKPYIAITRWEDEQKPHIKENPSDIPEPPDGISESVMRTGQEGGDPTTLGDIFTEARANTDTARAIPVLDHSLFSARSPSSITDSGALPGQAPDKPVAKRASPRTKKPVIPLTDDQRERLIADFPDIDVPFQIELALDHSSARNYSDMNRYLRNWMNNQRLWGKTSSPSKQRESHNGATERPLSEFELKLRATGRSAGI